MPEPLYVWFLGTGGSAPFNKRKLPCIAIKYIDYLILFDIGECAQFSLLKNKLRPGASRLIICISHFHADHTSGLPGLLHTLNLVGKRDTITIIGPMGLSSFFKHLTTAFLLGWFSYDIKLIEIRDSQNIIEVLKTDKFSLYAFPVFHGEIPCLGYIFREHDFRKFLEEKARELGIPRGPIRSKLVKGETVRIGNKVIRPEDVTILIPGRKIVYTADFCSKDEDTFNMIIKAAENADLLISEAAFSEEDSQEAKLRYHATAFDVGKIANIAKVRRLALIHISARYKDISKIVNEAKLAAGPNIDVFAPNDNDWIEIPIIKQI